MGISSEGIVGKLSALTGESTEVVTVTLCVVASIPVALFHRCFLFCRSPTIQHVYFFTTGLGLLVSWLGWQVLHVIIPCLLTYAVMCSFRPSLLRTAVTFCGPLAHLLWGFVSMGSDSFHLGWMAPACISAQAMFTVNMDLTDHLIPEEKKNADQKKLSLAAVPSLLPFLGYTFNPMTSLVGPLINIKEYDHFVRGVHLNDFDSRKYSLAWRSLRASLICIVESTIMFTGLFIGSRVLPSSFFLGDEFMEYNLVSRILLFALHTLLDFGKYIGVWKLLEAASCVSTLGYSGSDHNGPAFHLCRQAHLGSLLFAKSCLMYSVKFNCATHRYIKRYIFKRLAFLGNWYVSLFLSTLYISIWHGIHFGYMWAFLVSEFFILFVEIRYVTVVQNLTGVHSLSSLSLPVRILLRAILMVYTHLSVSSGYIGMSFLNRHDVLLVAGRLCFYCHAVGGVLLLVYLVLPAHLKVSPVSQKRKIS